MSFSVFSTHYFPGIRYMADLLHVENPVLDLGENFQKQTYRNRCNILSPNGLQKLIVPIKHSGNRAMKDLKISYAHDWQKEHLRSLEAAYRRSPYFEYYEDDISSIFEQKFEQLTDLNLFILEQLLRILQIDKNVEVSHTYISAEKNNFKNKYNSKKLKINMPKYLQVFHEKMDFQPDLSFLDLLFNEGPQSIIYLNNFTNNIL